MRIEKPRSYWVFSTFPVTTRFSAFVGVVRFELDSHRHIYQYLCGFFENEVTKIVTKTKKEPPPEDDDSPIKEGTYGPAVTVFRPDFHIWSYDSETG